MNYQAALNIRLLEDPCCSCGVRQVLGVALGSSTVTKKARPQMIDRFAIFSGTPKGTIDVLRLLNGTKESFVRRRFRNAPPITCVSRRSEGRRTSQFLLLLLSDYTRRTTVDGLVDEDAWPRKYNHDQLTRSKSSVQTEDAVVTDTIIRARWPDELNLIRGLHCGGPDGKTEEPPQTRTRWVSHHGQYCPNVRGFESRSQDKQDVRRGLFWNAGGRSQSRTGHKGGNDTGWIAPWKAAARRGESSWSVEMAIPYREMTGNSIAPGTTLGINFVRRRPDVPCIDYMLTSPLAKSRFYWSQIFADVICGPPSVAISKIDLPAWSQGVNRVGLELRNRGKTAETVDIAARALSIAGSEDWETQTIVLEPGVARRVSLSGHVIGDWDNKFDLKLTRSRTDESFYSATYSKLNFGFDHFDFCARKAVDELGSDWDIATSVDVRLQPDPYAVTLAPTNAVKKDGSLTVKTELISEGSGELAKTVEFSLSPGSKMMAEADTFGLPDGGYVLRIAISRENGETLLDTGHYFVCVGQEYGDLESDLAHLQQSIEQHKDGAESLKYSRSSFMFLEYLTEQAARVIEEGMIMGVYSTSQFREDFAKAGDYLHEAKKLAAVFANDKDPLASKPKKGFSADADPLAGKTGVIQRPSFQLQPGTSVHTLSLFRNRMTLQNPRLSSPTICPPAPLRTGDLPNPSKAGCTPRLWPWPSKKDTS